MRRWPHSILPLIADALPHRAEAASKLFHEGLRLLEGGEMTALLERFVVHEVLEARLAPPSGASEDLLREDADRDRDLDLHHRRGGEALPIEAGRGGAGRRKPVQHHVVEQLVARERVLRMPVAIGPAPELLEDPGRLPGG